MYTYIVEGISTVRDQYKPFRLSFKIYMFLTWYQILINKVVKSLNRILAHSFSLLKLIKLNIK